MVKKYISFRLQTTNLSASRFCSIRLHQGETRSRNVIGCYCVKNIYKVFRLRTSIYFTVLYHIASRAANNSMR